MRSSKPFQPRVLLLLAALLPAASLSGCSQKTPVVPAPPSLTQEEEMHNPAINRLYLDISYVQDMKRHDPMVSAHLPDEPITYGYGTDSLDNKTYHFANLHALQLNIKHRMDSLRRVGLVLRYDTTVPGYGEGPTGSHEQWIR